MNCLSLLRNCYETKPIFELFKSCKKRVGNVTAQKMKLSIKNLFGKSDQIRSFLRIWSYLLKKSLMENFIFSATCAKIRTSDNDRG